MALLYSKKPWMFYTVCITLYQECFSFYYKSNLQLRRWTWIKHWSFHVFFFSLKKEKGCLSHFEENLRGIWTPSMTLMSPITAEQISEHSRRAEALKSDSVSAEPRALVSAAPGHSWKHLWKFSVWQWSPHRPQSAGGFLDHLGRRCQMGKAFQLKYPFK